MEEKLKGTYEVVNIETGKGTVAKIDEIENSAIVNIENVGTLFTYYGFIKSYKVIRKLDTPDIPSILQNPPEE